MKLRNVISGLVALIACEVVFACTGAITLIIMYLLGLSIVGLGIFKFTNKIIGDITNGKKN